MYNHIKAQAHKDYILNLIAETEAKYEKANSSNTYTRQELEYQTAVTEAANDVYLKRNKEKETAVKYTSFIEETRKSLLFECIYRLFDACTDNLGSDTTRRDSIKTNIVTNFINENGSENLINSFRTKSELLSEFYQLIDKYSKIIVEKANKEDEDTFRIEDPTKDNFYEDLDAVNADEAIFTIRNRVMMAMDEFKDQNTEDKLQIKSILQDANERIKAAQTDELREAYSIAAKRKKDEIIYNRRRGIFETMVYNVSKSSINNDDMKDLYINESGSLNMESIVEDTKLLYTFLEVVNTTKMVKVDEAYISNCVANIA